MHQSSYLQVAQFVKEFMPNEPLKIIDIGSFDVNGSYKPLFNNPKWSYVGLDVVAGKNVDIVTPEPYHYPIADNTYDVVISGSCIEHVEDIYAWTDECIRILKPKGLMCIVAPTVWDEHKFPIDCWRFYPDGFRWLFVKRLNKEGNPPKMEELRIGYLGHDCVAYLRKV